MAPVGVTVAATLSFVVQWPVRDNRETNGTGGGTDKVKYGRCGLSYWGWGRLTCLLGDWDFVGNAGGGCVSVGDRGRDKVEVSILYFFSSCLHIGEIAGSVKSGLASVIFFFFNPICLTKAGRWISFLEFITTQVTRGF